MVCYGIFLSRQHKIKRKGYENLKKMFTSRNIKFFDFSHILVTNSLRKSIKSSLENLYVDIGAKGLYNRALP